MEITKDADLMICCIYREYLKRIKSGTSKTSAKRSHINELQSVSKLSKWPIEDISHELTSLSKLGFVKVFIGSAFEIQDSLIVYMENRFKNGFNEVTDFITKFIP